MISFSPIIWGIIPSASQPPPGSPAGPRWLPKQSRKTHMLLKEILRRGTAFVVAAAMFQAPMAFADTITAQPGGPASVRQMMVAHEPTLSQAREIALLRKHVKYVFVLFQENRSFDSYFGTFPGANGLFSQPAAQTTGFYQPIENT